MEPWHLVLHALDLPAGLVSLAAAIWIAAMMTHFVTHYRMQAEAVGGPKWPRLWWWVACVFVLFGAVLVLEPVVRLWPEYCVVGTCVRLLSCPVLIATGYCFVVGIRDGRGFYREPSRREHLERIAINLGEHALRQAQAERNGAG